MKNFLTILSILGCSIFASAQCDIFIEADSTTTGIILTVNTLNNMAVTFEWNDGQNTQSINADPNSFDYCVTATFANGCIVSGCYTQSTTPDCDVAIVTVQNGEWLQADATGTAPFTYSWNTGETDAAIPIGTIDTIVCVTMTDAVGCTATACIDVIVSCGVYVYSQTTPIGTVLHTTVYGNPPFTYNWSNGETTGTITPNAFGTYCLTVTDATDCESTFCYDYAASMDCEVFISLDSSAVGNLQLTANITNGQGPWQYIWNTGEVTQNIMISNLENYCVTVTDALGCSVSDCYSFTMPNCTVTITEEISANGEAILVGNAVGIAPISYQWNTGETTQSIVPNGAGVYSLNINTGSTPNNTCSASAVYYYDDELDCSLVIYQTDSTLVGDVLVAVPYGTGNFTYEWNTGATTSAIEVATSGEYCVTVTSGDGCVVEGCIFYTYVACDGEINSSGSNTTSMDLCAVGEGVAPFTYLWSTGETTECINTDVTGTYSVTITDSEGCVAEVCCLNFTFFLPNYGLNGSVYTIDSINGTVYIDSINGIVYTIDSINVGLNLEGWVYRIGINPDDGTASLIDSTEIITSVSGYGGYYDFGDVDAGSYIVKAALTEGSDGYETTLPTYHFNSLTWGEADVITVPTNGFPFYNISMMSGDNPGGPGGIYGSVIVGDGFVLDPIPNTSILLFDEAENPMLHTLTDDNGEFAFPSLPWGTYKVQVEIIGQDPAWYWVTIGPGAPTTSGLVFEVSEFGITTDISEIVATETFHVFPNPTTDKVIINFNAKQNATINISVTSLTGQILLVKNQQVTVGGQSLEMDLTNIPTGIYFLNMTNGKDIISQKIVKK